MQYIYTWIDKQCHIIIDPDCENTEQCFSCLICKCDSEVRSVFKATNKTGSVTDDEDNNC